jgi:hypothetical protein
MGNEIFPAGNVSQSVSKRQSVSRIDTLCLDIVSALVDMCGNILVHKEAIIVK